MPDLMAEHYTVGWICALQEEYECASRMLDEEFDSPEIAASDDDNTCLAGRIGGHYITMVCISSHMAGNNAAAVVARDMVRSFPNLRFILMVGVGGGAPTPERDIRLGDVVVSSPQGTLGGVVQYDLGKQMTGNQFRRTGLLVSPPNVLLGALPELRRRQNDPRKPDRIADHIKRMESMTEYRRPQEDLLFPADYSHQGGDDCSFCSPDKALQRDRPCRGREIAVHYGTIASGNSVMKDASLRDKYANDPELNILCFEIEAAGLMNTFPCLVIRGISASYARELLKVLRPRRIRPLPSLAVALEDVNKKLSHLSSAIERLQDEDTKKTKIHELDSKSHRFYSFRDSVKRRISGLDSKIVFPWKAMSIYSKAQLTKVHELMPTK